MVGPRPASGPDFNALLIGSEGTLGALTAAELRIRPQPAARDIRGFRFPDVRAGIEAIRKMLRANLRPSVVRLYDALDTLLGRGHSQDDESEENAVDMFGARAGALIDDLARKIPGGARGQPDPAPGRRRCGRRAGAARGSRSA